MSRPNSWTEHPTRAARPFTTMEGWRELGNNLYALRRASIRMITVEPEFDLERYHADDNMAIRSPRTASHAARRDGGDRPDSRGQSQEGSAEGQDPFDDVFAVALEPDRFGDKVLNEKGNDPFDDENAVRQDNDSLKPPKTEEPYHIFSAREKWLLVIIIGVTGMFSGLSSNIYFPALDTIAKARQNPMLP